MPLYNKLCPGARKSSPWKTSLRFGDVGLTFSISWTCWSQLHLKPRIHSRQSPAITQTSSNPSLPCWEVKPETSCPVSQCWLICFCSTVQSGSLLEPSLRTAMQTDTQSGEEKGEQSMSEASYLPFQVPFHLYSMCWTWRHQVISFIQPIYFLLRNIICVLLHLYLFLPAIFLSSERGKTLQIMRNNNLKWPD